MKQKLFSNLNNANAAKNEVKQKITNKNETLEIHEDKMQKAADEQLKIQEYDRFKELMEKIRHSFLIF